MASWKMFSAVVDEIVMEGTCARFSDKTAAAEDWGSFARTDCTTGRAA